MEVLRARSQSLLVFFLTFCYRIISININVLECLVKCALRGVHNFSGGLTIIYPDADNVPRNNRDEATFN